MKLKQTALGLVVMAIAIGGIVPLVTPSTASALECSVLPKDICAAADEGNLQNSGTWKLLEYAIMILTSIIGVMAIAMIAYAAFLYTTAQSDEGQLKKSKEIIRNVAIGIAMYALLWAFAQWLIPGGIFS